MSISVPNMQVLKSELECGWNGAKSPLISADAFDTLMFIVCSIIFAVWIWLLRYLYHTYNEFYVLLERIYSGEYFQNQDQCDGRSTSPESGHGADELDEAECIELDTFEQTED